MMFDNVPHYAIYNGASGYIFAKTTQAVNADLIVAMLKATGYTNAYKVRIEP